MGDTLKSYITMKLAKALSMACGVGSGSGCQSAEVVVILITWSVNQKGLQEPGLLLNTKSEPFITSHFGFRYS